MPAWVQGGSCLPRSSRIATQNRPEWFDFSGGCLHQPMHRGAVHPVERMIQKLSHNVSRDSGVIFPRAEHFLAVDPTATRERRLLAPHSSASSGLRSCASARTFPAPARSGIPHIADCQSPPPAEKHRTRSINGSHKTLHASASVRDKHNFPGFIMLHELSN